MTRLQNPSLHLLPLTLLFLSNVKTNSKCTQLLGEIRAPSRKLSIQDNTALSQGQNTTLLWEIIRLRV